MWKIFFLSARKNTQKNSKVSWHHRVDARNSKWSDFSCFIACATGHEFTWTANFNEATLWFVHRLTKKEAKSNHQIKTVNPQENCEETNLHFRLTLRSDAKLCCLQSLDSKLQTVCLARSSFDISQNMHRDWTDKWFCAIAIFIYTLFSGHSNANSILLNFQFHSFFFGTFSELK